jgi:hypothetical protein
MTLAYCSNFIYECYQLTVYFADLTELYLTDNLPPFGLDVLVDATLDVS